MKKPPSSGLFAALLVLGCTQACGTKEAEDPHKLLGDWAEPTSSEGVSGGSAGAPKQSAPKLASLEECRTAARRIEELGLELAVKDADSDDERAELEARRTQELGSAGFASRVEQAAKDCLGRETSSTEARCIAKARSEMEIDRCSQR